MAGDDLIFVGTGGVTSNDFMAGMHFNTIILSGSGFTLGGNAIDLAGGLTANHLSGANTVTLEITLLNAQSLLNANAGAALNFTGAIHTAGLAGHSNVFGTTALTFDGAGTTNVTGAIDGTGGLTKLGSGTVVFGGLAPNTYEGPTEVRQGVLRIEKPSALGTTTGGTDIQSGAALQVAGGITVAEPLAIREGGVGFGNGTDPSSLGALRSVGGNNTWTGGIELAGANDLIGVDAGSTFNVTGVISAGQSSTNRLIKVGAGTLQFTGTEANLFRGETRVLQGTLELGKTPGLNAIGGNLVIGDEIQASGTKMVRLLADNQIPMLDLFEVSLNLVTVSSTGVLDLNGKSDTVGNIVMNVGVTDSADIVLGGGTLILGGQSLTVNTMQGSSSAAPAATVSGGTFAIGSFFSGASGGVQKSIVVNDTQLTNVATDLNFSANLTGAADINLMKTGAGTLRLTGNNSGLSGAFLMAGGIIEIGSDNAFGSGLLSLQNDANALRTLGGARTIANPVSFDGNVTTLSGLTPGNSGDLTFNGNLTMTNSRTVLVMDPAQTVTINGVIGEGIFGSLNLSKAGRGTLVLTNANTYSGSTVINSDGGALVLKGAGSILNSGTVNVNPGGILHLDNDGGGNLSDRLNDTANLSVSGKLIFTGASNANSSEVLGVITPGQSLAGAIELRNTSNGAFTSALTANALVTATDRVFDFIGTGVALSETGANRFSITNNPGGLTNGILPMARVFGPAGKVDFASYGPNAEGVAIVPLPASAYVTDLNLAGPSSNVRLSANAVLAGSKTVNAVLFEPNVSLTGAGATLNVGSGAFIFTGGDLIGVDNLIAGNGLMTTVSGSSAISSVILSGNVVKAGTGTLVLSGTNQTSGPINISQGILEITNSGALGSPANGTAVRQGATLQINGSFDLGLEGINVNGFGFNANAPGSGLNTYASSLGALRVLSGHSTVAGAITQGGDATDLSGILGGSPSLNPNTARFDIATNASLNLSGILSNNVETIKTGGGTLEFSGIGNNTVGTTTRVIEGALRLNKEAGVNAVINLVEIGTDAPGAPAARLQLGNSDQISDSAGVRVHASGLFDLNGNTELIGTAFELVVGPTGAGSVAMGAGGMLTVNTNLTLLTVGSGNSNGATITDGTLALQVFGVSNPVAGTRTFAVNDGAVGNDLTITSAIVDGTGLQAIGISKTGFGTLEFSGTGANTFSGPMGVSEGTLLLNKGTGAGGVNAIGGPLTIGDSNVTNGFMASDVVRWLQSNQVPDFMAAVVVNPGGWMDLNGRTETIGTADVQTALTLNAAALVTTGAGKLTVNGNITASAANGANQWTPVTNALLTGKLDLGGVVRTIDIADRGEVPADLIIAADLVGTGGIRKIGTGLLQLSGANAYSGNTFVEAGHIAVGSEQAFGASRVYFSANSSLLAQGGTRTLANELTVGGTTVSLLGGNSVGDGGNHLVFSGPVNLSGNTTFNTAVAGIVDFQGGIGEVFASSSLTKSGFGTIILSSANTFSGSTTLSQNGGSLVLRGAGALLNTSAVTINLGADLMIDNDTGANLTNRINDIAGLTLAGGTLTLQAKRGAASAEAMSVLTLNASSSSLVRSLVHPTADAQWRFDGISRGATINGQFIRFEGHGSDLGATTNNRIAFTVAPSRNNGVIDFAVVDNETNGLNFATHRVPSGVTAPTGFYGLLDVYDATTAPLVGSGTFSTTLVGATTTTNVRLTANANVNGAVSANALLLAGGGVTVAGSGSLTLGSSLLVSGGGSNTVSVNTLNLSSLHGNLYVGDNSTLTIQSGITGNGGVSEVQRLTVNGAPDGGTTFTLSFLGSTTGTLTYDSNPVTMAATIQAALAALPTIGGGNIAVTGSSAQAFDLAFTGALASYDHASVTSSLVTPGGAPTAPTLSVAEVVKGSFGTLAKQGEGILVMSGGNTSTYTAATLVNEGIFRAEKSTAFGANSTTINANADEIQQITLGGTPTDATTTFTLTFGTRTTALITYSANPATTAASIASALGSLVGVGAANISVVPVSASSFDVFFRNALGQSDQATLSGTLITPGGATAPTVATPRNGGAGAGVTVSYGASIELANAGSIPAETLALNGSGEGTTGSVPLHVVAGSNTWLGNLALNTTRTGLDLAAGTGLTVNGILSNQGFNQFGAGTLQLGGAVNNSQGTSVVWNGILELNKTPGVNALGGGLNIGDQIGTAGSARVKLLASDQLSDTQAVTIQADGQLDLNGQNEVLGSTLTMLVGPAASASLVTGTGTLTLAANLNVNVLSGGRPVPATVSGNLALQGAAGRTLTVNDSVALEDLVIDATISDALAGWIKSGSGRMVLAGANSFTGVFVANAGETVVRQSGALGTGAGDTTISVGASMLLDGSLTLSENFGMGGSGFGGRGALVNLSGSSTLTGSVTLSAGGNTLIGVAGAADHLTLAGAISGAGTLTKLLPGTLTLGGGASDVAANSHLGTNVQQGTLILDKADGTVATILLNVGDNTATGGQDADVVRLVRSNQIAGAVTVLASGLLDFNGFADAIPSLSLATSPAFSGRVALGGGTLTLTGNLTQTNATTIQFTQAPSAKIEGGTLDLGSSNRTITTADGGLNIRELQIDAALVDGGAGLTVAGNGLTVFNANNVSLTGTVTLNNTNVLAGRAGALGTGTIDVTSPSNLFTGSHINAGAVTLANHLTLNADLTLRGDASLSLGGTISAEGAADRTLGINVNPAASLDLTGTLRTSSDPSGALRTLSITATTFNHNTTISGALVNGTNVAGSVHNFQKTGVGTVTLGGANTFDGVFTVNGGIVRATNAAAFGSTIGRTAVNAGALEVSGDLTLAEPLTLTQNVSGFNTQTGALRSTSGNNTWSGPITMGVGGTGAALIGVDAGKLAITGAIGQAAAGSNLTKVGNGVLEFAGDSANTYSGTTIVRAGTLNLNKLAGQNAMAGPFTVGDDGGGANADKLVALQANQWPTSAVVSVASSGQLDLSGASQGFVGSTALNEAQLITYSAAAPGSTFTITFAGFAAQTTTAIPYNAGATTVQAAIDTLLNTTYGFATGSAATVSGTPGAYVLTFKGPLAGANLPSMTVAGSTGLTPVVTTLHDGVGSEVQTLALGGTSGGTFTPAYNGVSATGALNFTTGSSPTAAQVQTNLGTIGGLSGNVTVIGPATGPFSIIFNNNLAGANVSQLTAAVAGGTTATPATTSNGIGTETQQITFTTIPTAGQSYAVGLGGRTVNVAFNAASALTDLQAAFDNLLGTNNALVLGPSTATNGSVYTVAFPSTGALGTANLPQALVRSSSGNIGVSTASDGVSYNTFQSLTIGGTADEVQTINMSASGGTYTVTLGASTSAAIAFNASASALQSALEAMPSIGVGNVRVSGGTTSPYALTFQGALADTNLTQITLNTGSLTGGTATAATTADGAALGGSFTLGFESGVTGAINLGDSAASIQTKLEALAGAGNIKVLGSSTSAGGTYLLLFSGARANSAQSPITATGSLTGTGANVTAATLLGGGLTGHETQSVTLIGNGLGGYFTLIFNGQVTAPIPAGASAAAVQAALEVVGTIGAGNVLVTRGDTDSSNSYYVTFRGANGNQDVPALTATLGTLTSTTTGFTPTATINTEAVGFSTVTNANGINLTTGPSASASISTGNNVLNSTGGTISVTGFGVTSGASPAASITGNLSVSTANRFLNLSDSFIPSPAEELVIGAVLSGAGSFTIGPNGGALPGSVAVTAAGTIGGTHIINNGTVLTMRGAGSLTGSAGFTINGGVTGQGALVLDNTLGNLAGAGRVGDAAVMTLGGGLFSFVGNGTAASAESVGALSIAAANATTSTVQSTAGVPGQSLTFLGGMSRGAGGTVNFAGVGADLGTATNKIFFSGINEQQTVALTGRGLGGTYTLSFNGLQTAPINFNAPATGANSVQAALEALDTIGLGNVTVSGASGTDGGVYTITFQGELAGANVGNLTATATSLTGASPTVAVNNGLPQIIPAQTGGAGRETQVVTFGGSPTSGSYLINLGGMSATATFAPSTLRTGLQTALESIVGAGNVTVVGSESFLTNVSYTVVFGGALAGSNVPLMTVSGVNLVGTTPTLTAASAGDGVIATSTASLVNPTLGFATLTGKAGLDFVTHDAAGGIVAAPFVTSLATATPSSNVKLRASETITGDMTINGLMIAGDGVTLSGGSSLQLRTGQLVNTGGSNTISTPLRFTGPDALYLVDPGSKLTLSGSQRVAVNETQTITAGANASTFTLSFPGFPGVGAAGTTAALTRATATGDIVQQALQSIPALVGNVSVTGGAGGAYTVNFINALAGLDLPAITAATLTSAAGNTTITVAETVRGGAVSPFVSEQQTLTVGQGVTGFTLGFNGASATALAFSAATTAGDVLTNLNTISALNGNVSVSGPAGGPYVVTFLNGLAKSDVPTLSTAAVAGGGSAVVSETAKGGMGATSPTTLTVRKELAGTLVLAADNTDLIGATTVNQGAITLQHSNALGRLDALQSLTLSGTLGGSFTLSFNGVTTPALTGSSVTAASLQATLEALSTIGAGNVRVEQSASGTTPVFRVWFQGALADQNVATLTSNTSGGITAATSNLRSGQSGATTVNSGAALQIDGSLAIGNENLTLNGLGQVQEVQKISLTGANAGTFTLSFDGQTTGALAFDATAAQVQSALNALTTVGGHGGNVSVERRDQGAGTVDYLVTFGGQFGNPTLGLDVPSLSVAPAGFGGVVTTVVAPGGLIGGGTTFLSAAGGTGVLRNLGGTSSWGLTRASTITPTSTPITLASSSLVGTDAGQLNLDATISGGVALTKVGAGTLELQGVQANTNAGTTTVLGGQLNLNKRATAANGAVPGALVIGDDSGIANAARVVGMAPDQIANNQSVTVNRSGQLTAGAPSAASEVQTVSYLADAGTFTLTFAGQTTAAIPFNAPATGAGSVQSALEALANIGAGNVAVSGSAGAYTVTFLGTLANANLPQMFAGSSLTTVGSLASAAVATTAHGFGNEVQIVTLASGGLSGSFTLNFANSAVTNNVPVTTARASLQSALEGLSNVGAGNVQVLGPASGANGGAYYVFFRGNLSGANVPQMTAANGTLANGGAQYPAVGVAVATQSEGVGNDAQTLTLGTVTGGTYTLQLGSQVSGNINATDTAATIQTILQAMTSIGAGNVRVLGGATGSGAVYQVIFTGALANADVALLTVANNSLTGGAPTVTPATVREGGTEGVAALTVTDGNIALPAGASLSVTGLTMQGGTISGAGALNLSGNVLYNAGGPSTVVTALNLTGGNRTFNVSDGASLRDLTLAGVISNGQLTKTGNGGLALTNAGNTFTNAGTANAGLTLNGGTLFVGADASGSVAGTNTALGAGSLALQAGTIIADGADRVIARPLDFTGNTTLGGRRDFGGTSDLTFSAAGTFKANTQWIVEDPLTNVSFTSDLGEDVTGRTLTKAGIGRLTLGGNNSYSGATSVSGGILRIASNNALGTPVAGTSVSSGAVLELQGNLTIGDEALTLPAGNAYGWLNRVSSDSVVTGVVRNLSGGSTWGTGATSFSASPGVVGQVFVGVDAGQLTFNGIISGAETLGMVGSGIVRLAGSGDNTYAGGTRIYSGVVQASKSVGNAIPGGTGVSLIIGDNNGGAINAKLFLLGSDQIDDTLPVTIAADGQLLLAGVTETASIATLTAGATAQGSASILVGDIASKLRLNQDVTVSALPGLANSGGASIDGIGLLELGGTRVFTVNGSPAISELSISATVSDGIPGAGLTKAGVGRLTLSGDNNYTGATQVNAGALRVSRTTALGTTAGTTTVSNGAALEVNGNTVIAEAITVTGNGLLEGTSTAVVASVVGSGGIRLISGNSTIAGDLTIGGNNTSIDVASGASLSLSGIVAFGNNLNTTKTGTGTLELSGAGSNTITTNAGRFYVNEGTLSLNKSGGNTALPLNVIIGDGSGGDNADVVRYAATAGTDQIGNVSVTVSSTGRLDLNGVTDGIVGSMTFGLGADASGDVLTGAGTLATTTVTTLIGAGTSAATPAATIAGKLSLNANDRAFLINRGVGMSQELDVSAVVDNGGLRKTGSGSLLLSNAANTFAGLLSVSDGRLIVGGAGALGTPAGATVVADGASILFLGGINVPAGERLAVSGDGFEGAGVMQSSGVNSFGGSILAFSGNRAPNTVWNVASGSLTLSGAVSLQNATVAVEGAGDLNLTGIVSGNAVDGPVQNGFEEWFYDLGIATVTTDINRVLATPSHLRKILNGQINFPDDASLTTEAGFDLNGNVSDLSAVWVTNFTPDTNGAWQFRTNGAIDDNVAMWIDFNQSGTFELSERMGLATVTQAFGPFSTPSLTAGQTYRIAIAFGDNTGLGAIPDVEFARPGSGPFADLDPSVETGLFTINNGNHDGFVKNSTGAMTLGSGNTFHDGVVMNSGTLFVNNPTGSGSGTGTGSVVVNNAAILAGTGAIGGPVVLNQTATLAPGATPGSAAFLGTGALTLGATSNLAAQVNNHTAGVGYDQVKVTGAVNLGGATLVTSGTVAPGGGDIVLIDNDLNDPVSGTFKNLPEGSPVVVGNTSFYLTYRGGDGNDVALTETAISIGDVAVVEGDAGTKNLVFTVSLTAPSAQTITVDYATAAGTAVAGTDYTPLTTTQLTFAPGETSKTVTVVVKGDTTFEANETFVLELDNPSGAPVTKAQGVGTITDDDTAPTLSIDDVSVLEGNSGTKNMTFTVSLSAASGLPVTVNYGTANGTALSGSDYGLLSGLQLTFAPGETSKTVNIVVSGDQDLEQDETLLVNLSNATGATLSDAQGIGTITNDDTAPTISIGDASVAEGNSGTTDLVFTVSLSAASFQPITVKYATANGTAIAPGDYTAALGQVTFAPGQTSQTITVPIFGETIFEKGADETLLVNLSAPTNADIADAQATGTILNDDDASPAAFTLDAKHPFTFFDANHDRVTINLAGKGTGIVSLVGGVATGADLSDIVLNGTDVKSALSITVKKDKITGDGVVSLGEVTIDGALKSFAAKAADLTVGGVRATGVVKSLTVHNLTHGEIITAGAVTDKMALAFGGVSDDTLIQTGATVTALKTVALGHASVSAAAFGAISTSAGALAADIATAGAIAKITAKGGGLTGDITAKNFGAIAVVGGDFSGSLTSVTPAATLAKIAALKSLSVTNGDSTGDIRVLGLAGTISVKGKATGPGGNMTGASIAAGKLTGLSVAKNLTSSIILAGADLGADFALGGGDDTFAAGSIGTVKVGGTVTGASVIGAGLSSTNATLKDGDDTILGGTASLIKSFTIVGTADPDSYFAAGLFKAIKVAGAKVTLPDGRFKTS